MSKNVATPLVARRPLATDPGHIRVKNQRISPWGILYTLGNVTYKNKKSTKNDSGKSCPRYKYSANSYSESVCGIFRKKGGSLLGQKSFSVP